jgi:hypothetical protein
VQPHASSFRQHAQQAASNKRQAEGKQASKPASNKRQAEGKQASKPASKQASVWISAAETN